LNRGKAALEFEKPSQAAKAIKHMDGGQLDGAFLTVQVSDQYITLISDLGTPIAGT
jgi:RNA-binding protein with serine-rich domain 1